MGKFDNTNTLIIVILLILNVGYLAVFPLGSAMLTYVFRIPALVLILLLIVRNYAISRPQYKFPLMIFGLACLTNIIRMREGFSFDLFLSIFSVFCLLFLIIISSAITITPKLQRSIYILSLLAAMVMTVHSFMPYSHLARAHDGTLFIATYLTFGYGNSNFAGIVAFLIYCSIWMSARYKGFWKRVITLLWSGWMLYLIFETNCRSAFIAAILVPVATILFRHIKLNKIFIYLASAVPFLFVPFYINLAKDTEENIEIMGKGMISGREKVYEYFLENLHGTADWILGTFDFAPFSNAHNGPLAIYMSVGIIGCLSFFYIIVNRLVRYNKNAMSHTAKAAVFSVIAVFIESCGESSLFLGGFPCIVFFFLFYAFANSHGCLKANSH